MPARERLKDKEIVLRAVDCEALGFAVVFVSTDDARTKGEARANAKAIHAAFCEPQYEYREAGAINGAILYMRYPKCA